MRAVEVRVRVPLVQTSAARVPNVVKDLAAEDHTARGMVAPREVEAVRTVAFVLLLIVVIAEAIVAFTAEVPAAILAASEVEAFNTVLFVLELIAVVLLVMFVAREVEAASTVAFVFVFTTPAIDEDAVVTMAFVFAFTAVVTAAILVESEVEALVTSDCTAREPDERVASVRFLVPYVHTSAAVREPPPLVRVRVPLVQTSAARVPNVVRDREALDQTARGIVAPRDVDAVRTVALVLLLMVVIAEAMVALTAVVTAAMFVESEVEARSTVALVLALTALVLLVMLVARDVEAVRMALFVLALTAVVTAAMLVESEVDAFVTSD